MDNVIDKKEKANTYSNGTIQIVSCIAPIDLALPKHVKEHLGLIDKLEDELGVNCCKVLAISPDKQGK